MISQTSKASRRSGLQGDVLSLYRNILRAAKSKTDAGATLSYARDKFRADAYAITRMDFAKIEFNLRQGHKRLKLLRMPGTMAVGMSSSSSSSLSSGGRRLFSTSTAPPIQEDWDITGRVITGPSVLAYDSPERPRVHVVSLGCGRNWVDSEVMLGSFLKAGYEVEPTDPSRATLMVVNTCGFLAAARDEADGEIRRLAGVKEARRAKGLAASLVVTGCMVNLEKEGVLVRHPSIDHLVGAAGIGKVLSAVNSGQRLLAIPAAPRDKLHGQRGDLAAGADKSSPGSERSASRSHLEGDDGDDDTQEMRELAEAREAARASLAVGEPPSLAMPLIGGRLLATPPHTAYLKVAEGCRKKCTFCIIPAIKGPLRSKSAAQVAKELRALVGGGVREVSVIAQDLGDFGKDLTGKERADNRGATDDGEGSEGADDDGESPESPSLKGSGRLAALLEDLVSELRGSAEGSAEGATGVPRAWLRLLYLYPDEIDSAILKVLGDPSAAVAPYVDMPLQHVSSTVLRRMGRKAKYDRSALEFTLTSLQSVRSRGWTTACGATLAPFGGVAVRTTLMVGFPGETEADFQELLGFVKEWGPKHLHHVGVFEFSAEPGARASAFPDQVPSPVKRRRRVQLEAAHTRNVSRRHRALAGTEVVVLVDHLLAKTTDVRVAVHSSASGDDRRRLLGVGRHPGQALSVDGVVKLLAAPVGSDSFAMPRAGELWVARVEAQEEAGNDLAATLLRPLKWGVKAAVPLTK